MSDGPEGLDFFVLHDVAIIEKIVILGGRGQAIIRRVICGSGVDCVRCHG